MTKKRGGEKNSKNLFKKFWHLLWKDDSFKGWIFSAVVIFLFIKFIFFPLLNIATGTTMSLVIVESCSMYHQGNLLTNLNLWWEKHESKYSEFQINKEEYQKFPLKNGFNKGDILFIIGSNSEKLKVGDIIIFKAEQKNPIIHRIVEIREKNGKKVFSTIGDNNNGQLLFEKEIPENILVGKAKLKLATYLGWIKLVFYEWKKPYSERGFCNEN